MRVFYWGFLLGTGWRALLFIRPCSMLSIGFIGSWLSILLILIFKFEGVMYVYNTIYEQKVQQCYL